MRLGRPGVVAAGVAVAGLAAASIVWIASRDSGGQNAPGGDAGGIELAPPASGMVVAVERLGIGNSSVPDGTPIELMTSVSAQAPLAAVELWAGDTLAQRREIADVTTATRLAFTWASVSGDAILTARAIDTAGRTALSNAIRVSVGGRQRISTVVDYTIADGDTAESIAAAHGTSAQLLALANPGAFQPEGAQVGVTVQVPVEVPFPGDDTAGDGPPRAARTQGAPPAVDVVVDGCTVEIPPAASAGAEGITAYVLPPDAETFELLAAVKAGEALTFAAPPGSSMLVVGTFAGGVQTLGPPQPLSPAADCADGWTGDVRLEGTRLRGGADADSAYLYISTGGAWARVPEAGAVDRNSGDGFDFAGLLPDFGSGRIDLEAWGRKGGALVRIGKGSYLSPATPAIVSTQHLRTQLWWIKTLATGGQPEQLATAGFVPNPGVLPFRWKPSSPVVTKAAWQVTSYLVPATAGLDIPGVIAQGFVGAAEFTFTIDFSTFTGKPPVATASASAALGPMAAVGGPIGGPAAGAVPNAASQPVSVGASGPQLNPGLTVGEGVVQPAVPEPSRFYVRLVPFVGDQFAGRASPSVVIDTKLDPKVITGVGEIDLTPGPNVYDLDVTVTAPVPPIPWFAKCWRITDIDPTKFDPAHALINKGWQVFVGSIGNVVCPICYKTGNWQFDYAGLYGWHCADDSGFDLGDPSSWDEFPILGPLVSGLIQIGVSTWDFVVELATYLKAKVVDLVALVGCESFVNAGSAAAGTQAPGEAKDWCHTVAEIAVDAALISAGIPPTLPTFEEAMQAAKGELVDLIIEQASALGVPCDEADLAAEAAGDDTLTCKALAEALLDDIVETTKAAVSASASAVSGIFFPPGVSAVPHEAGQTKPGVVTVKVSPTADAPLSGFTCPATVVMSSSYTAPDTAFGKSKFPELNIGFDVNYGAGNGMWIPAKQYGGWVIEPTTVALPKLVKSQTGSQALQPVTKAYSLGQFAAHDPVKAQTYVGSGKNAIAVHAEVPYQSLQLHPGATITTSVHAACAGDVTVIGTILGGGKIQVTKVIG